MRRIEAKFAEHEAAGGVARAADAEPLDRHLAEFAHEAPERAQFRRETERSGEGEQRGSGAELRVGEAGGAALRIEREFARSAVEQLPPAVAGARHGGAEIETGFERTEIVGERGTDGARGVELLDFEFACERVVVGLGRGIVADAQTAAPATGENFSGEIVQRQAAVGECETAADAVDAVGVELHGGELEGEAAAQAAPERHAERPVVQR